MLRKLPEEILECCLHVFAQGVEVARDWDTVIGIFDSIVPPRGLIGDQWIGYSG